jgi:uncharacterized membrane protein YidH (DUF202 family)
MKSFGFKKIVFLILLGASLSIPLLGRTVTLPNPTQWDTVEEVIQGIIDFIFYVAIVILPIMLTIAGFFFLSSGGDQTKTRTARNILFYSVIGLVIVLFAKGLIAVIKSILGVS